jgi:environmental stress-induced protein Ves
MINRSKLFKPADFRKIPWKNGLGVTTELVVEVIDDDVFAWRLSMARVAEDGPFSDFTGYQRTLVLLDGEGITLAHAGQDKQALNNPLDLAQFDGKGPTTATLHHGPIEDFNIMTRSGICTARVTTGAQINRLEATTMANFLLIYAATEKLTIKFDCKNLPDLLPNHLLQLEPHLTTGFKIDGRGFIAIEIFYQS